MRFKIFNLFRERVPRSEVDQSADFVLYGPGNNYPLMLAQHVEESVIAAACIDTRSDFIEGEGFNDVDWETMVINSRGETLAELHSKNARSLSLYQGYYNLIIYNADGDPVSYYFLPFENCRLGKPDSTGYISKIIYNSNFATEYYRVGENIVYEAYTPSRDVVKLQIEEQGSKFKGQVFFWGTTSPRNRIYPMPEYFESGKQWMRVDWRIGNYHDNNLANGFLQPVLMSIVGNPHEWSTNPEFKDKPITVGEEFDRDMTENFSGTERVGNIWVQWLANKDEIVSLQQFPGNNQESYMTALVNTMRDLITTATKVPGILANIATGASLGGDGNTIRAAVKLMQQRAAKWQHVLERNYTQVFYRYEKKPSTDISIVNYNPFPETASVDPSVWGELSTEERRKWIQDNTEVELIDETTVPPAPDQVQNSAYSNMAFSSYPEKARENARKAVEWMEQTGKNCNSKWGKETSSAIIQGQPLPFPLIKRIRSYLEKNSAFKNSNFDTESCYAVLYQALGGEAMYDWAEAKYNEVWKS